MLTTIEDLQLSLQKCLDTSSDLSTKTVEQQSLLTSLQSERAAFEQKKQVREQEHAAFRSQVKSASENLAQARDYTSSALGSIRNAAHDEELAAQEHYDELHTQLQALTKKHQDEEQQDQPFIDDLEAKIRSAKLAISQLESQQSANGQTRNKLREQLGKSLYEAHSMALNRPRERQAELEKELARNAEVYAKMRKNAFSQLNDYPDLKCKLQEENDIADNSDIIALTQFATFCEYVASHPIKDMGTVTVFEIDSWNIGAYEGGSNSHLFTERAKLARQKLAELNHQMNLV